MTSPARTAAWKRHFPDWTRSLVLIAAWIVGVAWGLLHAIYLITPALIFAPFFALSIPYYRTLSWITKNFFLTVEDILKLSGSFLLLVSVDIYGGYVFALFPWTYSAIFLIGLPLWLIAIGLNNLRLRRVKNRSTRRTDEDL